MNSKYTDLSVARMRMCYVTGLMSSTKQLYLTAMARLDKNDWI